MDKKKSTSKARERAAPKYERRMGTIARMIPGEGSGPKKRNGPAKPANRK